MCARTNVGPLEDAQQANSRWNKQLNFLEREEDAGSRRENPRTGFSSFAAAAAAHCSLSAFLAECWLAYAFAWSFALGLTERHRLLLVCL